MKLRSWLKFSVLVIGGLPAWAAAQQIDIQGPRVQRWPMPTDIVVKERFIRQGEITADGMCRFKTELSAGLGETMAQQEIAYDPDTCRSVVVRGPKAGSPGQPAASTPGGNKPVTAPKVGRLSGAVPEPPAAGAPVSWASFETWFVDPIRIKIHGVDSNIWWRSVGECASGDYQSHQPNYFWLTWSGWRSLGTGSEPSADCSSVSLNSTARYENRLFPTCLPGARAIYEENRVVGTTVGYSGQSTVLKEGPAWRCTSWWAERQELTGGLAPTVTLNGEIGCPSQSPALFFSLSVPPTGGSFNTTSSGNDYDGDPIYFKISGTSVDNLVTTDVAMYSDPGYGSHIRTDRCVGRFVRGVFRDDACDLIQDTSAGCEPIWMGMSPAGAPPSPGSVQTPSATLRRK